MRSHVGRQAPELSVEAYVPGEREPVAVSLAPEEGAWTVLFFYPRDFTFVCPTELAGFGELQQQFAAAGARVLAASTDSYWSHKAWFESHPQLAAVRYPVIADTSQRLADAFGVLLDDGAALRATFVIDRQALVRHATVSDLTVGRNPHETLRVLQALQTGELCPVSWRPGEPTLQIAA